MKMYQDLKKCPLCGGNTKKKGSVYLEFMCQERGCEAIVRFPSELKIDADEQIRRFNNRIYEPDMIQLDADDLTADDEKETGDWVYNRKNPQTGANIFRCSLCKHEICVFTCGIKYPAFDKFCGGCGRKMNVFERR